MPNNEMLPDNWSVEDVDWTTVPWYRKPLPLAALAALAPPVALIILWTGPTFYLTWTLKRTLVSDRYRVFATIGLCMVMLFWMLRGTGR